MELEEMKKIWDEQTKSPIFIIDEDTMTSNLKKKLNSLERKLNRNEKALLFANLGAIGIILISAIMKNSFGYVSLSSIAVFLVAFLFTLIRIVSRKKANNMYEHTMLGMAEKAVEVANSQVKLSASFLFVIWPVVSLLMLSMIFFNDISTGFYIGIIGFVGVMSYASYLEYNHYKGKRNHMLKLKNQILSEVS